MLENIEEEITKRQSRETGNTEHTRRWQTKQKHRAHKTMTNKTKTQSTQDDDKQNKNWTQQNINKTWTWLQTTGGQDEPNIVCMRKS
jgi:hypothetical protein